MRRRAGAHRVVESRPGWSASLAPSPETPWASTDPADLRLLPGDRRRNRRRMADDDGRHRHVCRREAERVLALRRVQVALRIPDPAGAEPLGSCWIGYAQRY